MFAISTDQNRQLYSFIRRRPHTRFFNGGLSTDLPSGRFPVDVSTVQNSAFLRSQTVSAPEPPHFRRSDTRLPCLSARSIHPDSSPDTAGDNPPHKKFAWEPRSYLSADAHSVDAGRKPAV